MVRHHGRSHFNASKVSQGTGIPVPAIVGIVIFIKAACIACCCIRYCRKKQGNSKNNNSGIVIQQASKTSDDGLQSSPQSTITDNPTQGYLAPYQNYSSDHSLVFGSSNQNFPYPSVYPMQPIGMNPPYSAQYPTYPVVNDPTSDVSVNPTATTEAHLYTKSINVANPAVKIANMNCPPTYPMQPIAMNLPYTAQYPTYPVVNANQTSDISPNTNNSGLTNISVTGINITDAANPIASLNHPTEKQSLTNLNPAGQPFFKNDVNPTCTVEIDNTIQSLNQHNPGIKTNASVKPNGIQVNSNELTPELTVNTMDPVQTNRSVNSSTNRTTNNIEINPVSVSGENVIPSTCTS